MSVTDNASTSNTTSKSHRNNKHKWQHATVNTVQGIEAILVTCDTGIESACFKQVVQWLYELHTQLYGNNDNNQVQHNNTTNNVADNIQAELAALQHADKFGHNPAVSGTEKLFVRIPVKMRGNVLIGICDKNVSAMKLCTTAIQHIHTTQSLPVRYAIRMQPIQRTCYSTVDDLVKVAETIRPQQLQFIEQQHSTAPPKTYAIEFNRRGSNVHMQRMDCINKLVPLMPEQYTVNLSQPDIIIRVDSIERVTGLCAYYNDPKFNQFNIRTLYETIIGIKIDTTKEKLYDDNDDMTDET